MKETDLRWQLRQLPRELEPGRDLWPGIASGIARPPVRRKRTWPMALAAAASVLLAAGLFLRAQAPVPAPGPDPLETKLVGAEARAISHEYQAALRQFEGAPVAPQVAPSLSALDRSVAQIQSALVADPDSVFLLDQLRRTYSLRLELTRRAVVG
jgi:hypothetical protein